MKQGAGSREQGGSSSRSGFVSACVSRQAGRQVGKQGGEGRGWDGWGWMGYGWGTGNWILSLDRLSYLLSF